MVAFLVVLLLVWEFDDISVGHLISIAVFQRLFLLWIEPRHLTSCLVQVEVLYRFLHHFENQDVPHHEIEHSHQKYHPVWLVTILPPFHLETLYR